MSRSPFYFIEKRNDQGEWENVYLYTKDKDGNYDPWMWDTGNADENLFSLIFDQLDGSHRALPRDLAPDTKDFIGEEYDPTSAWYDYVELSLIAKSDKAIVTDYWEDEYNKKVNGLTDFMTRINMILSANYIWDPYPGQVRIICLLYW